MKQNTPTLTEEQKMDRRLFILEVPDTYIVRSGPLWRIKVMWFLIKLIWIVEKDYHKHMKFSDESWAKYGWRFMIRTNKPYR